MGEPELLHLRRKPYRGIAPGTRVKVLWGRWAGRTGVLEGQAWRWAGGAGERPYAYVALAAQGRAAERSVVVVGVAALTGGGA